MRLVAVAASAATFSLATAASATSAMAQTRGADLTFAIKATYGSPATSTIERFLISGSRVRMEIATDPANPALGGMYMIVNSAESTMMSVMPSLRSAMIARLPAMAGVDANLGTMAVSDVTRDSIEDLGSGERMLDRDTHHYRITRTGTLTTTRSGNVCSSRIDDTEDVWIAADAAAGAEMHSAERRMDAMLGMGRNAAESWIEVFDAAAKTRPPRGLALRSERRSSANGAGGKPNAATYTMEYIELSNTPIDSSMFTVPAGFRVQDSRGLPAANAAAIGMVMSAGMDSQSRCPGGHH